MSIILNEKEWAEQMLNGNSLGKHPTETLRCIARYYLDNGYGKVDTRLRLEAFILRCDPKASLVGWSDTIDRALKYALKTEAVEIESIIVTKPEMKIIDSIKSKQCRRLAFTLLCLSKYWNLKNKNNTYWVKDSDNEIMKMANINTSLKRQGSLLYTLKESGLISFNRRVDNTDMYVLFADEEGEPEMEITDFRNLGYQYLLYHGEPFYKCQNCGLTVKYSDPKKKKNQKYCRTCATEIFIQQKVNAVMRYRNK